MGSMGPTDCSSRSLRHTAGQDEDGTGTFQPSPIEIDGSLGSGLSGGWSVPDLPIQEQEEEKWESEAPMTRPKLVSRKAY